MKKLLLVILFLVTFDCVLTQETFLPFKLGDSKEFVLKQMNEKLGAKFLEYFYDDMFSDPPKTDSNYMFFEKVFFLGFEVKQLAVLFKNDALFSISAYINNAKDYMNIHFKLHESVSKVYGKPHKDEYNVNSFSTEWKKKSNVSWLAKPKIFYVFLMSSDMVIKLTIS